LKEKGEEVAVNRENLHEWIRLYSSWRMADSVQEQLLNITRGFYDIIPVQLVSLFNEFELEQLLCGLPQINTADWRQHAVVVGCRSESSKKQIEWFWEIMEQDFTHEQRGQILQFVTGSAQVPLTFRYYNPPFTIALIPLLPEDSLPYGHTCFNRIDLPVYSSKEKMMQGLLKVLDLGLVGFGKK